MLVIDETSMVDVGLLAALLAAVRPGTRVLFVGDPDQLPSVQPGAVLRDLIDSGVVPVATLREIRRADSAATSVRLCHAISGAKIVPPDRKIVLPGANWVHVDARGPDGVAEAIEAIYRGDLLPTLAERFSRSDDFLTLVPYRSGKTISADVLNPRLRQIVNPTGVTWSSRLSAVGLGDVPFGPDDRVMCTRNRWLPHCRFDGKWIPANRDDVLVANGVGGKVLAVDEKARRFIVDFDLIGTVGIQFKDHYLEHAYAVTIHKAQGSGVKVAIVPVLDAFAAARPGRPSFWSRELLYTAVSRTTDVLVTVGEIEGIRKAVLNPSRDHRRTLLAHLLRRSGAAGLEAGLGGDA
jgi:exodeoxyribonuclease V alpha subunit